MKCLNRTPISKHRAVSNGAAYETGNDMYLRYWCYLWVLLPLVGNAQEETSVLDRMSYDHPIPFAPRTYVCYQAEEPLRIDGKLDEADWQKAPWTEDFVDIEGERRPRPIHRTRAKMLWDDTYFYFAAILEEPNLWATLRQRDTVIFYDDDFEIFIDPDGDGHNYYEFEMNALNTVWDLLMLWPYHVGRSPNYVFNWNNPGLKTAVHLNGTLNDPSDRDEYWSVEIAFPWTALRELAANRRPPTPGEQWRVNFSRVDWHMEVENGRYVKQTDPDTGRPRREENWVWSPTGRIDMHRPETWGYVQFSDAPAGSKHVGFAPNPEEEVKWALWQLFYQQVAFYQKFGLYTANARHFTLPEIDGRSLQAQFYAGSATFEISAPAMATTGYWHIDETGRLWLTSSGDGER